MRAGDTPGSDTARGLPRGPGSRAAVLVGLLLAAPPLAWRSAAAGETVFEPLPPTRPFAEGRPVFEQKGCSSCHAVGEDGSERKAGPDLVRDAKWRDVMQFSGSLWNHAPAMREAMRQHGVAPQPLSPEETEKLAAYLFSARALAPPGDPEGGRKAFAAAHCARCHQLGGIGGTIGPRLDELREYASVTFLAQALWNHGPEMTARMAELGIGRAQLNGKDLMDIVAFLRGTGKAPPAGEPGSPRSGQALFRVNGCIRCHVVEGTGGSVGPNLDLPRPRARDADMAAALWNHGPPMWTRMRQIGIPFPRFAGNEMADVFAYLTFLQYTGEQGDPARGAELFHDRSCADCHSGGNAGTAPDLSATPALQSPAHWASAMWNHPDGTRREERFAGNEMRDLVAFLRSRRKVKK